MTRPKLPPQTPPKAAGGNARPPAPLGDGWANKPSRTPKSRQISAPAGVPHGAPARFALTLGRSHWLDPPTPDLPEHGIGYIAMRPRSMKNEDGVHGLFGYLSQTEPVDKMPWQETAKYVRQLSKQNVNIFRSIISFNRADADELGLVTQKDWREYAEQHIRTLAEKNGIDIGNLGWCSAYHNEGDHPHLHIVFWDKAQEAIKDFVSPKIPNAIRVALIKTTFEIRLHELYEKKKLGKEKISGGYGAAVVDFDVFMKGMRAKDFKRVKSELENYSDAKAVDIKQYFNSDEQLAAAAEKLFALRNAIPKGGRVSYKLMPPEVKAQIDGLTDELINNNTYLKTAIEQYIDTLCELKRFYNSLDDPDKLKEYRDKCEADARQHIGYQIVKSIYQHGSAKWLTDKEKETAFDSFVLDPNDPQIKELLRSGYDGLEFLKS